VKRLFHDDISKSLDEALEYLKTILLPDQVEALIAARRLWEERHLKAKTPFFGIFTAFESIDSLTTERDHLAEYAKSVEQDRDIVKFELDHTVRVRKELAALIFDGLTEAYGIKKYWDWIARRMLNVYAPEYYNEIKKMEVKL